MLYKTITLALLQQSPGLYQQLRRSGTLIEALDQYAAMLRESHLAWTQTLRRQHPARDPHLLSSQALEMAVQALQDSLPDGSSPNAAEPLSLDAAMDFIRSHTPPA